MRRVLRNLGYAVSVWRIEGNAVLVSTDAGDALTLTLTAEDAGVSIESVRGWPA
jgi:hypothetical protein